MKQRLLNTWVGRALLYSRDRISTLRAALFAPDMVSMVANDQLATNLVTTLIQSNKIFIDVGAHIGSIISEVVYNNPSASIIAVEAIPDKSNNLRRKFPFIEVHNTAVGDFVGEVSFFINTRLSGYSTLGKPSWDSKFTKEIKVQVTRLDDLVTLNNIDVIKIDVEGAELGVLRGSTGILRRCRPIIMFESAPEQENDLGYTKVAMHQFLTSHDYVILIPNRVAHNDPGLTQEGFIESHLYPRRTTNYFAIPRERRIEVRDRARSILKIRV